MDPENKSGPGGRDPQDGAAKRTPNTDMQADDAGTADSGQDAGTGTEAESAMKQTSKTDAETGNRQ
jgi:hypothetical protein